MKKLAIIVNFFFFFHYNTKEVKMCNLQKLIELRNEVAKLQYKIKQIMPLAIAEALDIYAKSNTERSNQIIFNHQFGKIGLVFKQRFLTTKDDATLARIDEDIKRIQGNLSNKYSLKLSKIESEINYFHEQIQKLDEETEKLLTNKQIIQLKQQFTKRVQETTYIDPNLSVFLN